MIPDDNPESGSKAETSGPSAARPRGRSRYPRGRRGPRRPPRGPRPPQTRPPGEIAPQGEAPESMAEADSAGNAEHEPVRSPDPRSRGESHPAAPPVPKGRAIYAAIEKVDAIIVDLKD